MADTRVTQEEWDAIFGKKEVKEEEKKVIVEFKQWWDNTIDDLGEMKIVKEKKPLQAQRPMTNDL